MSGASRSTHSCLQICHIAGAVECRESDVRDAEAVIYKQCRLWQDAAATLFVSLNKIGTLMAL